MLSEDRVVGGLVTDAPSLYELEYNATYSLASIKPSVL